MSMWSNDIKCKYMFMFPLKNLARKGLRSIHVSKWEKGPSQWKKTSSFSVPGVGWGVVNLRALNFQHCITFLSFVVFFNVPFLWVPFDTKNMGGRSRINFRYKCGKGCIPLPSPRRSDSPYVISGCGDELGPSALVIQPDFRANHRQL